MAGIKSDRWIREMALEHGMIEPFEDRQIREGVVSYGLSSYGYDIRVGDEFKIFTNINNTVIDPKNFDPNCFVDVKANVCIVAQFLRWRGRSKYSASRATS
jgi:dCTP deaminase